MTINLEPMMLHMAWANQEIFKEIAKLPDDALNAYVTNQDWHVAEILHHIVQAADNYGCRVAGGKYFEFPQPKSMKEVLVMSENLKKHDARLLELAKLEDKTIEINRQGKISYWQASTILSQSIHHATEHRAQAIAALEFRGFTAPSLDDYDLWSYEFSTK